MTDRITFARNGQIKRGTIRVGWIDDTDSTNLPRWRLRFTPASGIAGVHGRYALLRDAKQAARDALGRVPSMTTTRRPARPRGTRNTPEHNAAIAAWWAAYRGFSDQDVLEYYRTHTNGEVAEWFGVTPQRISQIVARYGVARPRGVVVRREVAA